MWEFSLELYLGVEFLGLSLLLEIKKKQKPIYKISCVNLPA